MEPPRDHLRRVIQCPSLPTAAWGPSRWGPWYPLLPAECPTPPLQFTDAELRPRGGVVVVVAFCHSSHPIPSTSRIPVERDRLPREERTRPGMEQTQAFSNFSPEAGPMVPLCSGTVPLPSPSPNAGGRSLHPPSFLSRPATIFFPPATQHQRLTPDATGKCWLGYEKVFNP